ncbi:MAG: Mammalian cell entry related protein [Rhodocyclaceae bacterium]|nr:Mammalian cell entry related protein [Rhodocyclaceae bacterium]
MENKSHAFLAGLFAILLGLATVATIYWFGGKREATREYVVVTRQNVTGLNPQAQVRYRGIRVGKVSDIRLDPQDVRNILITIEVDSDVPVTRGTVAKLSYQGVTGLGHILLEETGKDPTPPVPERDGEPPRIAMAPSLLDELSASGKDLVEDAREVLNSAQDLLNERNRQKFAAILSNLEASSGQMKPTMENLNATLVQVRQLLNDDTIRKISRAAGEAGPLLVESRALVAKLQTTADKLDVAIGEPAAGGAATLMPRLNELASDISATSRQLNRVLKLIEDSPQSLVFGAPAIPPGPGEPGFVPPVPRQGGKP